MRGGGRQCGRVAGPGRRAGRGAGAGLRRIRRAVADRPAHSAGPGGVRGRSRCAAHPHEPHPPPGRVQLTILGDTAYGTGELRERLQADGHTLVIKPPPPRPAIPRGFTIDDFTVYSEAGTAPLPARPPRTPPRPQAGGARRLPPRRPGRGAAARRAAAAPAWREERRLRRPPAARPTAWLVARGNRRVPYRGVLKNDNWLHHRAAALNLRRLVNLGLARTTDGNWALA